MRLSNRRNLGCVSSAQRQLCCLVRLRGEMRKGGSAQQRSKPIYQSHYFFFYRSYCRRRLMTHALWLTLSPTADNGGFHSLQPTSASQSRVQKGAYGGVQKLFIAGVHSWGLFPLMVKTFCSGSNQAHCRDSTFYIHEMRAKDGKESEMERTKEEGEEENREEGLNINPPSPPSNYARREPPVAIESEAISLGWRGADQWSSRSVKSCRILCVRRGRVYLKAELRASETQLCPWTKAAFIILEMGT